MSPKRRTVAQLQEEGIAAQATRHADPPAPAAEDSTAAPSPTTHTSRATNAKSGTLGRPREVDWSRRVRVAVSAGQNVYDLAKEGFRSAPSGTPSLKLWIEQAIRDWNQLDPARRAELAERLSASMTGPKLIRSYSMDATTAQALEEASLRDAGRSPNSAQNKSHTFAEAVVYAAIGAGVAS